MLRFTEVVATRRGRGAADAGVLTLRVRGSPAQPDAGAPRRRARGGAAAAARDDPARRRSAARRRARRRWSTVRAAAETLSLVRADDAARCWRAPPTTSATATCRCRSAPGWLAYEHDHVLDDMVAELGLAVETRVAPFEPEAGGYRHGGAADTHGTDTSTATTTTTDGHGTRTTTDASRVGGVALTRLLQLVSPALPIGAFAYSQGLEQAVAVGWVTDEASAARLAARPARARASATLDLPVLARLHRRLARRRPRRGRRAGARWLARLPRRRASCAPRSASSARRWRALLDGARRRRAPRPGPRAPDVTHAAMFALAAARFGDPASAGAGRLRVRLGRGARPAPPCAWCRSARAPGSGCWPRAGDAIPAAVARARDARRRRARRRRARPGHRQRAGTRRSTPDCSDHDERT